MSYFLQVAPQPKLGTCKVTPSEGNSLEIMFTVKCISFADEDVIYSFYIDPREYDTFKHGELVKLTMCWHPC